MSTILLILQNKKFKISVFPIIEDWTDFGLAKKILRSK